MTKTIINPDYLFEVSWEVCNKVGGIYTVIATKSLFLKSQLNTAALRAAARSVEQKGLPVPQPNMTILPLSR